MRFHDRAHAGRMLAVELERLAGERTLIVGLPRGGVPVAFEVARALDAPLEVLSVRKLGAPGNPELAIGAIAEDGTAVVDARSARELGVTDEVLAQTIALEARELRRRVQRYRAARTQMDVRGSEVIVVDDGLATGMSDLAAVRALRARGADRIVVAAPVGSRQASRMLEAEADGVVCVLTPKALFGVGAWYDDFAAVSDEHALALLGRAQAFGRRSSGRANGEASGA